MANLLDFQTVLWPEVKTSNVGFYRKPYAGFPAGSVIQAPFTRSGAGRKVINASGNLVDAAANVPAWTFPIGGRSAGCPYLSFLPSVENKITRSEEFDNADWGKEQVSVTANSTISPDGTTNADTITEDSSASTQHRIENTITISNATVHTFSCFVKRGTGSRDFALINVNAGIRVYFNLETGVVDTETLGSGGIIPFGDYYFCYATGTSTATAGVSYLAMTDGTTVGSETYNGDGTSSLVLWGAMLKEGSYISPLDYVKTEASAVTRSADDVSTITPVTDGFIPNASNFSIQFKVKIPSIAQTGGTGARFFYSNIFQIARLTDTTLRIQNILDSFAIIYTFDVDELINFCWTFDNTSGTLNLYVNGFLAATATNGLTGATFDSLEVYDSTAIAFGVNFKMLNFAPTALTANQAEAASSWPSRELMFNDLGLTQA